MTRYKLSMADSVTHIPEHPNRTAYRPGRGMTFDYSYQVWPNRASMLKTIAMQEHGAGFAHAWQDWSKSRMATRLCPSPLHPKGLIDLGW